MKTIWLKESNNKRKKKKETTERRGIKERCNATRGGKGNVKPAIDLTLDIGSGEGLLSLSSFLIFIVNTLTFSG